MSEHTTWTDQHGADLTLEHHRAESGRLGLATDGQVVLSRDQVLELYHFLGDHLMATNNTTEAVTTPLPDATADGYDWPTSPTCDQPGHMTSSCPHDESTVATEAHSLVYGNREDDYGHPREDFTRTAIIWTGLLHHKLADGAFIDAEDIARCMVGVKLSRDVHSPKRDNRVDGIGYFITLDRLETGK